MCTILEKICAKLSGLGTWFCKSCMNNVSTIHPVIYFLAGINNKIIIKLIYINNSAQSVEEIVFNTPIQIKTEEWLLYKLNVEVPVQNSSRMCHVSAAILVH